MCGWLTGKKGVIIRHYGHGADPCEAKSAPHPHAAVWAPDGKYVIVADLGTDDLTVYRVDRENRVLCADAVHSFFGAAGWVRVPVCSTKGAKRCYVLCEISSGSYDLFLHGRKTGIFTSRSFRGRARRRVPNSGADLHLAPDGCFLYVSNRGIIQHYRLSVQRQTGHRNWCRPYCGGRTPRNFALDPTEGGCCGKPGQRQHCRVQTGRPKRKAGAGKQSFC